MIHATFVSLLHSVLLLLSVLPFIYVVSLKRPLGISLSTYGSLYCSQINCFPSHTKECYCKLPPQSFKQTGQKSSINNKLFRVGNSVFRAEGTQRLQPCTSVNTIVCLSITGTSLPLAQPPFHRITWHRYDNPFPKTSQVHHLEKYGMKLALIETACMASDA